MLKRVLYLPPSFCTFKSKKLTEGIEKSMKTWHHVLPVFRILREIQKSHLKFNVKGGSLRRVEKLYFFLTTLETKGGDLSVALIDDIFQVR